MNKRLPIATALALLASLILAGCAGQPTRKDGVVSGDQYEYVTPLGSNIPVLVKKGERPATVSPTDVVGADQAANAIHSGGGQAPTPAGQKP